MLRATYTIKDTVLQCYVEMQQGCETLMGCFWKLRWDRCE